MRWRSGPAADALATSSDDLRKTDQPHPSRAPVQGQAAVWIVERPTVIGRDDLYPLPAVEPMAFADCIAGVRGPGQPFRKVVDLRDLRGSRLLRMVDQRAAPWHALRIATPAPIGTDRTQLLVSCCG